MRKIYYIVTSILAVLATILFVALTLSPSPEDDGSMFIITLLLIAMAAGCLVLSVIGLKNNNPIRPVVSEKAGILIGGFGVIVFVVGLFSDGLMLQALPIAIPALALGILCFVKGKKKLEAAKAAEKWEAYKEALFAKMPSPKATLREGASAADIRDAENELGLRFPEELKGLYLANDGDNKKSVCGMILGLHFLSLNEMRREWRSMKKTLEDPAINNNCQSTSTPEGCIKRCYGNNKWLPLASDASGNYIGIDLDPDIHGTAGQIINWGRDEENKMVFAKNADAFWERLTGIVNSRDFFIGDYDGEDVILLGTDDIEEGTHLTDYLKHTASPETAAYYEIAGLLGLSAAHRGMIDSPARYYVDHKANFEERSVGADETNAIRWI
nr:SMI1/KNR4 family protein [Lachnospiraceae bacterium]